MDKELERELNNIIDNYIDALEYYEDSFRKYLVRELGVSENRLYLLPMDMYYLIDGLKHESWLHQVFMGEDCKYAQDYYKKTLESFAKTHTELTDITENGIIYESMLLQTLKEVNDMNIGNSFSALPKLKTKFDFEGVGFYGNHGDIVFTIKGIQKPILIDAKYSNDRSQIIEKTDTYFNNIESLKQQIIDEINRGLSQSISYYGTDEWFQDYIKAKTEKERGNINKAKSYTKAGQNQPKILIYIFKDKGMWSSQAVKDIKERVIDNATVIYNKNNRTTKGESFNKDLLWYGTMKVK